MDKIFVSWGSPDESVVGRIIGRLDDLGMPVNTYSRDLPGGGVIREYVVESIKRAAMVLAVVSVQALDHSDWVREEITLAVGRLDDRDNKLERLVLVRVGEVPDDRLPVMLQPDRLRFLDLDPNPGEEQLEQLIMELHRALGQSAPFVVPAAVFAMTRKEFDRFLHPDGGHDPVKIAHLTALCQSAGMPAQPDLWHQLRSRYGATTADFAPYVDKDGEARRLIDVAQDVLRAVNRKRSKDHHQPLHLRWYSREDFAQDRTRDQWRRGHSVLIVDSVSAMEPAIAAALQSLPLPDTARKAAVVCLPPYTRHNAELEELIRRCLEGQYFLADTFREWRQRQSERSGLAFDLPAETSLRRWLDQLLLALETALEPDQGNISKMLQDAPTRQLPAFRSMPGE